MACPRNPLDCIGGVIGGVASSAADSGWNYVVGQFEKGLADTMKAVTTFWLQSPAPDLTGPNSGVRLVNDITQPLVAFAAVIGLLIGGSRLALRAHDTAGPRAILRGLLLMAVVGGGAATIAGLLLTGADSLSSWILNQGFDGQSVGQRLGDLLSGPAFSGASGLIFILTLLGLLSSLCQYGLLLVRGGLLAVVIGMLPVSAAASITDTGYDWFKKMCGWSCAFILYKPAAAIIYAAGFYLIGNGSSLSGVISGFALIVVSVLALPALMRLIVPAATRIGGGGHGGAAAVAGTAATGAMVWSGGRGGSTPNTHSPGLVSAAPGGPAASSAAPTGAAATAGGSGAGTGALPAGGGMPGYTAHIGMQAAAAVHGAAKSAAKSAAGEE